MDPVAHIKELLMKGEVEEFAPLPIETMPDLAYLEMRPVLETVPCLRLKPKAEAKPEVELKVEPVAKAELKVELTSELTPDLASLLDSMLSSENTPNHAKLLEMMLQSGAKVDCGIDTRVEEVRIMQVAQVAQAAQVPLPTESDPEPESEPKPEPALVPLPTESESESKPDAEKRETLESDILEMVERLSIAKDKLRDISSWIEMPVLIGDNGEPNPEPNALPNAEDELILMALNLSLASNKLLNLASRAGALNVKEEEAQEPQTLKELLTVGEVLSEQVVPVVPDAPQDGKEETQGSQTLEFLLEGDQSEEVIAAVASMEGANLPSTSNGEIDWDCLELNWNHAGSPDNKLIAFRRIVCAYALSEIYSNEIPEKARALIYSLTPVDGYLRCDVVNKIAGIVMFREEAINELRAILRVAKFEPVDALNHIQRSICRPEKYDWASLFVGLHAGLPINADIASSDEVCSGLMNIEPEHGNIAMDIVEALLVNAVKPKKPSLGDFRALIINVILFGVCYNKILPDYIPRGFGGQYALLEFDHRVDFQAWDSDYSLLQLLFAEENLEAFYFKRNWVAVLAHILGADMRMRMRLHRAYVESGPVRNDEEIFLGLLVPGKPRGSISGLYAENIEFWLKIGLASPISWDRSDMPSPPPLPPLSPGFEACICSHCQSQMDQCQC